MYLEVCNSDTLWDFRFSIKFRPSHLDNGCEIAFKKKVCVFRADQEDNYQTIRIRNSLLIFDLHLVIERGSKCPAPNPRLGN